MPSVTSVELARILDLESKRRVEQLVHEGMPRAGRGRYDVGACMAWYIRFLKKNRVERVGVNRADAARERIAEAEAQMKEIALERERGTIVSTEEMAAVWEDALTRLRESMMTGISKQAPNVVGLKTIPEAVGALKTFVYAALNAASRVGDEVEAEVANGRDSGVGARAG